MQGVWQGDACDCKAPTVVCKALIVAALRASLISGCTLPVCCERYGMG